MLRAETERQQAWEDVGGGGGSLLGPPRGSVTDWGLQQNFSRNVNSFSFFPEASPRLADRCLLTVTP